MIKNVQTKSHGIAETLYLQGFTYKWKPEKNSLFIIQKHDIFANFVMYYGFFKEETSHLPFTYNQILYF
jgi:hypothetical protein